jgi:hypothetical protein
MKTIKTIVLPISRMNDRLAKLSDKKNIPTSKNRIGGVMVSMLTSSAVDCELEHWSGQGKVRQYYPSHRSFDMLFCYEKNLKIPKG